MKNKLLLTITHFLFFSSFILAQNLEGNNEEGNNAKYFTSSTDHYFNSKTEISAREGSFLFDFADGLTTDGDYIEKVTVTQIRKEDKSKRTVNAMPTIFLVPGGGFTAVLSSDFINNDPCTGKSLAVLLADQGYNVFVITYQIAAGIERTLLNLSLGHVCNTVVTDSVKYLQERASYRSFWSLRKLIRDKTATIDSLLANNIDINNMLLVGHSAGGFLTLYSLFLDQSEIPSTLCSLVYNACAVPANWRNQHWPLPAFKGYVAMSGATFRNDIFLNNSNIFAPSGPNLLLMHGTCDELVNQYVDFVPSKCKIGNINSTNVGYTKNYPNPNAKFNTIYGSGYIYQQLYGTMSKLRYEQVCDGGHAINNPGISRPFSTQSNNAAVLFGQWNTCDLDNPTGSISTQHLLFNRLNDFASRTLFNSPGPVAYQLINTPPELPSQKCLGNDYGPITPITGITNDGCSISLIGGIGGTIYVWYIFNVGSPPQLVSVSPTLDVSNIPNGTFYVAGVAANACDIQNFLYLVDFDCNSFNRIGQIDIQQNGDFISVKTDLDELGKLIVVDMSGRVIYEGVHEVRSGNNVVNINDIKIMQNGTYVVSFLGKNRVSSTKVVYYK